MTIVTLLEQKISAPKEEGAGLQAPHPLPKVKFKKNAQFL